jgi:hypothetical protein
MQKHAKPQTPKQPDPPAPNGPASIMPSVEVLILVYVILALFGFYLLYMYEPFSAQRLFNWLFGPWIS